MTQQLKVGGKLITLDPNSLIGSGGEGDVWDIGSGLALKVFKGPRHPDYSGSDPQSVRDRKGAVMRLRALQRKLTVFPKLPACVIAPRELVRTKNGLITGYTMQYIQGAEVLRSYAKATYRNRSGTDNNKMQKILLDLHGAVTSVHSMETIIGDFNNLGVLVLGGKSYLIDADSFQFGDFLCRSFTPRFVDPLVCKPDEVVLAGSFTKETDWYAFALMVFESLTLVAPYSGVIQSGTFQNLAHEDRPLHRLSVLHKDVRFPDKGIPLDRLPDDVLHFYHELLEKDVRGAFPQGLLERTHWTMCASCGREFATRKCPGCLIKAPSEYFVEDRRGALLIRPVFRTSGRIVSASIVAGKLAYLCQENGVFKREHGRVVIEGELGPRLKYRLLRDATLFSEEGAILSVNPPQKSTSQMVDSYRGRFPVFDSNGDYSYRIASGRLVRDDDSGERFLMRVIPNQTLFWVGTHLGLVTYRVGEIRSTLLFDANTGNSHVVELPRLVGDPLDARCYFTSLACWFFLTVEDRKEVIHHCFLIDRHGKILAHRSEKEGAGGWLETLSGKVALSRRCPDGSVIHALLSVGDLGLIRVEQDGNDLVETTRWPDAKGVLRPTDALHIGADGLYVVRPNEILSVKVQ